MSDSMPVAIFISHSGQDSELAESLVNLLRSALRLGAKQIRCTSVDGSRLEVGSEFESQLRADLLGAPVFLGILSPSSSTSTFVLFELGARWGAGRPLLPLLAKGLVADDLRRPLSSSTALNICHVPQIQQVITHVAAQLSVTPEELEAYYRFIEEVIRLSSATPPRPSESAKRSTPDVNSEYVEEVDVPVPEMAMVDGSSELERKQHFTATLQEMKVTESTTVRCRYDWNVHIVNIVSRRRGFFGHVSFRDTNGYEVARTEIPIDRPFRAPAVGEETYCSFLYVAPQHARLIRRAELSLMAIELTGSEESPAVTLEWRGVWPQ